MIIESSSCVRRSWYLRCLQGGRGQRDSPSGQGPPRRQICGVVADQDDMTVHMLLLEQH
jgi:hypothetical protein